MADQSLVNMSENTGHGKVEISPEVLEVIAGIAASEIEGLANMRGNFATGVVERFGKKSHSKGVKVELTDEGILIDLYVVLEYGVSIPEVAQKIQGNIRQTLKNMTSLEISEVNIHVVGLQMEKETTEEDSV
ncbi:Asp23/Gls24 family envelope stress response protein [Paucisalibacillus globulus]|uniref:Asp23/Gls24 family envelope stress response protein n=1 Tax=Paucisalibacillus globulus TaxID=351095 RepID=UPI0004257BBE|nr:Asp23/Gls24 family envelope stress response protein [Paucisalibacillus globulus]